MKIARPYAQTPWSIQLEVVDGCNFSCWFCGIHSVRKPGNWFTRPMDIELVKQAFGETKTWLKKIRVELNNHGEPALHPDLSGVIRAVKTDPNAQIQLQTNGSTIETWHDFYTNVGEWFESGLNLLCINAYKQWGDRKNQIDNQTRYEQFMKWSKIYVEQLHPDVKLIDHYYGNPDHLSIYRYYSPRVKMIFVLDDLGEVNKRRRMETKRPVSKDITNEAGNSPERPLISLLGKDFVRQPLEKKCTRVFRELTIAYDGHIPICCYDWRSQIVLGKFPEQSLQEIWESPQWMAVRELLYRKNRHMAPCDVCDYNGGWRQGLITPPGLSLASDEALQELVATHMEQYQKYAHHSAPIHVGPFKVR